MFCSCPALAAICSLSPPHRCGESGLLWPFGGIANLTLHGRTVLSASLVSPGLYRLDLVSDSYAAGVAAASSLDAAVQWHRRSGHASYSTLADMQRKGLLPGSSLRPSAFLQAGERSACDPCLQGKTTRVSHAREAEHKAGHALFRGGADLVQMPSLASGGFDGRLCSLMSTPAVVLLSS